MTITRRELALTSLAALALPATARAAASELRVGFSTDAQTLDPANHRSRSTETIIRQMYDGVLTRSPAMKVDPQLAASWTERNPTTYDFVLQPNVKFHSGATMTAEDVKFTFDRLIEIGGLGEGQTSPRKSLLGPLKEVQITGPLAVRFVLATPWPILPAMLPFQEVASKAFVTKVGTNGVATREDGTGPFRLAEWRRGDSLNLERFAQYWGGSPAVGPPGPAKVDRVVIKIIPENAARVAALLAGDVDIIDNLPSFSMHDVAASRTAAVMKVNGTRSFFIALNNAKKPFTDVRVRQALNYGLDKRLIIKKILNDTATPLAGVLAPTLSPSTRNCHFTTMIRARPKRCWPRPAIPTAWRRHSTPRGPTRIRPRRWQPCCSVSVSAFMSRRGRVRCSARSGTRRPSAAIGICFSPPGATARSTLPISWCRPWSPAGAATRRGIPIRRLISFSTPRISRLTGTGGRRCISRCSAS